MSRITELLTRIETLGAEVSALDNVYAELSEQIRQHRSNQGDLSRKIEGIRVSAAIGEDTDKEALANLKREVLERNTTVEEISATIALNRDRRSSLTAQREQIVSELKAARRVAAKDELDSLKADAEIEACEALARFTAYYCATLNIPFGMQDATKIVNKLLNEDPDGKKRRAYQAAGTKYLNEIHWRLFPEEAPAA